MKVYELLDSPDKWTKGAFARNQLGQPVLSDDPTAVCWFIKVYGQVPTGSLVDYNDILATYEQLIAFFKKLDI